MAHILTVTMNPAVDIWTSVGRVEPLKKLRCGPARRDPGGGGINVARVACRLGSVATALYPAGGNTGQILQRLLDEENIRSIPIQIHEETRQDFTALETTTGHELGVRPRRAPPARNGVCYVRRQNFDTAPHTFRGGSGPTPCDALRAALSKATDATE
jgi:hypothetical protein